MRLHCKSQYGPAESTVCALLLLVGLGPFSTHLIKPSTCSKVAKSLGVAVLAVTLPLAPASQDAVEYGFLVAVVLRRSEERCSGVRAGVPYPDRNSAHDGRGEAAGADEAPGPRTGHQALQRTDRGEASYSLSVTWLPFRSALLMAVDPGWQVFSVGLSVVFPPPLYHSNLFIVSMIARMWAPHPRPLPPRVYVPGVASIRGCKRQGHYCQVVGLVE